MYRNIPRYVVVILGLVFMGCASKKDTASDYKLSDAEVYTIVNDILLKGPYPSDVVIDKCKALQLDASDKALMLDPEVNITPTDIDYLVTQTTDTTTFTLNNTYLKKNLKAISLKEVEKQCNNYNELRIFWDSIHKKYPGGYTVLSKPVLTKNKNILVIKLSHYCGPLCGTGGVMIFVRKDNSWELRAISNGWDS